MRYASRILTDLYVWFIFLTTIPNISLIARIYFPDGYFPMETDNHGTYSPTIVSVFNRSVSVTGIVGVLKRFLPADCQNHREQHHALSLISNSDGTDRYPYPIEATTLGTNIVS